MKTTMTVATLAGATLVAATIAAASLTLSCCASTDATTGATPVKPARSDAAADGNGNKTLSGAYRDFFPIGAAVAAGEYGFDSLEKYPPELLAEYGSLTAENAMKPVVVQPRRGSFSWKAADAIAEYARANGMRVRGHTLVWHNQSPTWMFKNSGSVEERRDWAREVLREHMTAVMTRYKGTVYCWDVVNEAIADNTGKSIYRTDSPCTKCGETRRTCARPSRSPDRSTRTLSSFTTITAWTIPRNASACSR